MARIAIVVTDLENTMEIIVSRRGMKLWKEVFHQFGETHQGSIREVVREHMKGPGKGQDLHIKVIASRVNTKINMENTKNLAGDLRLHPHPRQHPLPAYQNHQNQNILRKEANLPLKL